MDTRPELGSSRTITADPDAPLVARCLRGDEVAWEALVKLHTRRVYAICLRFTGRAEQAQDLTQEVFLRVFRNVKSFDVESGCFRVWLTSLTRNLLIDHYRRTRKEKVVDSIEDRVTELEATGTPASRPEDRVAGRKAGELLQAGLEKLSPEHREIIDLVYYHEKSVEEVAEIVGIPENTVKTRMFYARKKLAELLEAAGVERGWP
jgi:RNA polymerase sigma-70 factor (ECF subfamily)